MKAQAATDITDGEQTLVKQGEHFNIIETIDADLDLYLGKTNTGNILFAVSRKEFYPLEKAWQSQLK